MPNSERELNFCDGDEVIEELRQLQSTGYQALGNWNLTQICQHLMETMNGGMKGFGFRMPWFLRATYGKWFVNRLLNNKGFPKIRPTLKQLKPTHSDSEDDRMIIDDCVGLIVEVQNFEGPLPPYPLADNVSLDQWKQLMWVHAAHHLKFLLPKQDN